MWGVAWERGLREFCVLGHAVLRGLRHSSSPSLRPRDPYARGIATVLGPTDRPVLWLPFREWSGFFADPGLAAT